MAIDLTYDSKEQQPGEIREYAQISGGCFLCVRTDQPCKYNKTGTAGLTREHIEHQWQAYWWLAEAGEAYNDQANALRDLAVYLENILDVEDGVKQGYLIEEAG